MVEQFRPSIRWLIPPVVGSRLFRREVAESPLEADRPASKNQDLVPKRPFRRPLARSCLPRSPLYARLCFLSTFGYEGGALILGCAIGQDR